MNKKDEILRCALEIVSLKGMDALTLNSLSEAVGLSKASMYHYFSSKEEIISQMLDMGHRNIMKNGFLLDLSGEPKDGTRSFRRRITGSFSVWSLPFTSQIGMHMTNTGPCH